jgi:hypothetical protein
VCGRRSESVPFCVAIAGCIVSWHIFVTTKDLDRSRRVMSWDIARFVWWRASVGRIPRSTEASSGSLMASMPLPSRKRVEGAPRPASRRL